MDALSFVKIKLLADSKNIVNCVQNEDWIKFTGLNASFQTCFEENQQLFGEQLNDILPELLADNKLVQSLIEKAMKDTSSAYTAQLNNVKSIKKYLKGSV